jgi:hypothetical protein
MSKEVCKKQSERSGTSTALADPLRDKELEDLIREAEEVLLESQAPSGDWSSASRAPLPPAAGEPESWKNLDSEAAFWLLFPPRGNA